MARVIRNYDVASLYPSLMVYYHYMSRNIPYPKQYEQVYHNRLMAKKIGDKATANTLKLVLNTTYGATLAPTNPLYDPLMGRSVCITGQLCILELCIRYMRACHTIRIIQLNTDGIMISLEEDELPKIYDINNAWMAEKHLILEEDKIKAIYQKDVNNYICVFENGKVKTKGGYVTWGIPGAGAFSINNNHVIVKKAVVEYFVHKTPVRDTIYGCQDIHDFQIIAKAGGGYRSVYAVPPDYDKRRKEWQRKTRTREINGAGKSVWKNHPMRWSDYDGPRRQTQRVNRVYASSDPRYGTLVKVKPDGTIGKIGGLPDHCVIDNKNALHLESVDREWYVALAEKYIADYMGGVA